MGLSETDSVLDANARGARGEAAVHRRQRRAGQRHRRTRTRRSRRQALATRTAEKIFQLYFGGDPWVGKEAPISSIDDMVTSAVLGRAFPGTPAAPTTLPATGGDSGERWSVPRRSPPRRPSRSAGATSPTAPHPPTGSPEQTRRGAQRPVCPNPPSPRVESGSASTTCRSTSSTACTTSWAMRSPALHLVLLGRVGVHEQHLELVAVAASMRPGVLRQVTPCLSASPLRGCTKPA